MFAFEWQLSACKPHIVSSALWTEEMTGVMDSILIIAARGVLYTDAAGVLDSNHDFSCMGYIHCET